MSTIKIKTIKVKKIKIPKIITVKAKKTKVSVMKIPKGTLKITIGPYTYDMISKTWKFYGI